jgi:DNA-binding transcriptional MerR regulator
MQAQMKNTFTIRTLVERYGVSAESFRNWERQGLIPPARRTPGGHRRFGPEHIEALERLFHIQSAMVGPVI